jgi:hypothetical protein
MTRSDDSFEDLQALVHELYRPGGAVRLGAGIEETVREQQSSRGYAFSYISDGWVVREYADGRTERVRRVA